MFFTDYLNGQILTTVGLHIRGHWKGTIICHEEDNIPTPLCCHGVNVRFLNIIFIKVFYWFSRLISRI